MSATVLGVAQRAPEEARESTRRSAARVAGFGYLVIIACGLFAELVARGGVIVAGDATATADRLAASDTLFRAGIASDLVMLIADAVVAVALWIVIVPHGRAAALFVTAFRLLHTAVTGAALVYLVLPLILLGGGAGYAAALPGGGAEALASVHLDAHRHAYNIGLVFFAVHLAALGWVLFRSRDVPRWIAVLLVLSALAYALDGFTSVLSSAYTSTPEWLMAPMVLGELSLCIWLILFGVRAHARSALEP